MYRCPHCELPEISYAKKFWSSPAEPTECPRCNRLSYAPDIASNSTFSVGVLLLILTAAVSITTGSWFLAGLGLAGSIACYGLLWHTVKLKPTTAEQVATARKLSWGTLIAAGLITLFS